MGVRRTLKDLFKAIYQSIPLIRTWNWSRLFLCIVISCFIWSFQALNKSNYHTTIKFPLVIEYARKDVVALEDPPQFISVQVSGSGWRLLQKTLGFGIIPLHIDIEDPTQVKYFTAKSLMPDIVQQLSDLRVDFIAEDSVHLNYDSTMTKQVVLFIDSAKIPLVKGHRIASRIFLDPDSLTISGAASFVTAEPDSFEIILEEELLDENHDEMIDIAYEPPRKVSFFPDGVKVKFDVDLYFKKTVTIPIKAINFPEDSSAYLARQLAIVEYDLRRTNETYSVPDSLYILADYKTRNMSDSTLEPIFSPPDFMENIKIIPEKLILVFPKKIGERKRSRAGK
ncbi:hypothetical protein Fleli_1660 [Bernardetia litoralis DSM 6794]|uniref:YbbR-like protein n=1 Tax=Bernardetia litoralis (strain ATCC 23117 / DSM 6794 / NBRC 15988 / NCIMB 1366 / Fx l1 / Sio-4) TaxID=880071 RepID=I4AJD5_BERLS|nr:hypothetical protein [Bernardetia litoralis]AFM04070.1 hypothetical protein Fleli_1660 [Bernardetia litoralis DSM 6794]